MISYGRRLFYFLALVFLIQQTGLYAQVKPAPAPAPPAAAKSADASDDDQNAPSIMLFYWLTNKLPALHTGKGAVTGSNPSDWKFPGTNKGTPGVEVSFPAGRYNTLRVSYMRGQHDGTATANRDLVLFGTDYSKGDSIMSGYTFQNAKASWQYLSWPYPVEDAKFRLYTLWEAQYISLRSNFDTSSKNSAGTVLTNPSSGTNWFVYPSLGLGIDYAASKHFHWELKGSGFMLPHRAALGDAETSIGYRFGQLEIQAGAKYLYFKSTPKKAQYVVGNLPGVFVGVRWYLR